MKKLIPLLCLLSAISFQSFAQKKQNKPSANKDLLTGDKWTYQEGKVEFVDYKGRRAMKLNQQSGPVVLKDLVFKDGVIEYDIEPVSTEFADALYFHRKNEKEQEANYIRSWAVTQPAFLTAGTEPTTAMDLPKNESFTGKSEAETGGLVNLTRQFGGSEKRRIVWLRTTVTTKDPVKTYLQLGFSDEVWVYLNNQLTYVDKNLFTQNMRKYPEGRISVQNASVRLNLKQGTNDLMIGVANDFYGWGIIARLETIEGITEMEAYNPPAKIAIENIEQYPGVYAGENVPVKVIITQKNGELISQVTNQEPIPLTYAGNNIFKIEKFGVEVIFKPAEKKLIFKQNTTETEFVRE